MLNKNTTHFHNPLKKLCHLRIIPFTKCNFSCSYCDFWKRKNKEISFKLLKYFLEKKFIPAMKNFDFDELEISLQGGELTIKNLDWFDELIDSIKILKKLSKENNIVFFTNFYRKNEYYYELANKLLKEFDSVNYIISWHEEFWKLDSFLKKIDDFTKYTNKHLTITSTFFKEIKNNKLFDKLFDKGHIQFQTINDFKYHQDFKKYKSFIRPVICYAYDYVIEPDMTIKHYCDKQKFSFINFKPKIFYICNEDCACSSQEYIFKKKLLKS